MQKKICVNLRSSVVKRKTMALIVAKFGGTSVADIERINIAAGKVAREVSLGHQVVVVVSGHGGRDQPINRLLR